MGTPESETRRRRVGGGLRLRHRISACLTLMNEVPVFISFTKILLDIAVRVLLNSCCHLRFLRTHCRDDCTVLAVLPVIHEYKRKDHESNHCS